MRICKACKVDKGLNEFRPYTTRKGKACHTLRCKDCLDLARPVFIEAVPETTCSKCHRVLPAEAFHKNKLRSTGLADKCKSCQSKHARTWYTEGGGQQKLMDRQRQLRRTALSGYGAICRCCGESDDRFLTLDHVNNDGAEHRKTVRAGTAMYRWVVAEGFPENIQVLCLNCNLGRQFNGGVCPHQDRLKAQLSSISIDRPTMARSDLLRIN